MGKICDKRDFGCTKNRTYTNKNPSKSLWKEGDLPQLMATASLLRLHLATEGLLEVFGMTLVVSQYTSLAHVALEATICILE